MKLGRRSLFGGIASLLGAKQAAKKLGTSTPGIVFTPGCAPAPEISYGNDPYTGCYFESSGTSSLVVDGKKVI